MFKNITQKNPKIKHWDNLLQSIDLYMQEQKMQNGMYKKKLQKYLGVRSVVLPSSQILGNKKDLKDNLEYYGLRLCI